MIFAIKINQNYFENYQNNCDSLEPAYEHNQSQTRLIRVHLALDSMLLF